MTGRLLETTWFLLWLFAIVIVGRWAWRLLGNEPVYEPAANWRNLYRQALVERDETKLAIRIQEAEGAILVELATQVFRAEQQRADSPSGCDGQLIRPSPNSFRGVRT
jgi:hypothetical protein